MMLRIYRLTTVVALLSMNISTTNSISGAENYDNFTFEKALLKEGTCTPPPCRMDTTKTLPQQSKAEIKYIEFEETNIDLVS